MVMHGLMQDYPLTLPHIFDRAEKLFSQSRISTASHAGMKRMSYGEWAERVRRLGGALDILEVSESARVGSFAWNTGGHLELYFGVPCSGRVLHTLNIRLFPEQIAYIVNHAEDEVIFVDRSLLGAFWPLADELKSVHQFVVMDDGKGDIPDDPRIVDYEDLLAGAKPVDFHVEDERRAAVMCYTSGTTGNPKGVLYSHRSTFLHSLGINTADALAISETDVLMPIVPMFHANAWGTPYAGVFAGADFVMPGPDLSPQAIVNLFERERVTISAGVPTIWMSLVPLLEGRDLSSVRTITSGGSAVPKALSEAYREKIGAPLFQGWGMTETSPLGSLAWIKSTLADRAQDQLVEIRAKQGLPLPCVDARIVDVDAGNEVGWDGESFGELQVRGPWVASAYYKDTSGEQKFTRDGWLRTGDVATIDPDGYIHLVDRTKDVIKSGGEWVSSVDLENEIMAHPKVAEAAVIGVHHPKWQERPLACVVVRDGEQLAKEDVLQFLEPRIANWWMPDDVVFVDEIPKTSVGKFSKKDLRARFSDYELPSP
jgi:fatty-acyl-CoA synthase